MGVIDNYIEETESKIKVALLEKEETEVSLNDISDVKERTFDFEGTKVTRFFYHYKDKDPLLIPVTVHRAILNLRKEYGERLSKVKVKKRGQGKKTEYTVIPLLD